MRIIITLAGKEYGITSDPMNFNFCQVRRVPETKKNENGDIVPNPNAGDPVFVSLGIHSSNLDTVLNVALDRIVGAAELTELAEVKTLLAELRKDVGEIALNINKIRAEAKADFKPNVKPAKDTAAPTKEEPFNPFM